MIPTLMIGDHIFVAKYAYGPLLPYSDTRLYSRLPPARADVMVFKFPERKEDDFIKRVIALPGDKLEVLDGRPIINDWLVPHCYVGRLSPKFGAAGELYVEYLGDKSYLTMFESKPTVRACQHKRDCAGTKECVAGRCGRRQGPYPSRGKRIAKDEVWVLGDNRNNSHDSRSWRDGLGGGVPLENIKGRAMFVWLSWHPGGDFAFSRLFTSVMGPPRLPKGIPASLLKSLNKCLQQRPPVAKTTPPKPPNR